MKTVVALPGEGIGVEVVDAACELMTAAGMPVKILTPPQTEAPAVVGWLRWEMDVVVAMNQYADILSDIAGEIAGGLGVAPFGNFGDDGWAYFESVHGSAPDIAGRGIANPTATILSTVLLLEHVGLAPEAARLEAALSRVYRDGKTLAPDQGGSATTKQMAAAVLAAYRNA